MKTLQIKEIKTRKKPTYSCIAITERCFMRCRICYKWKDDIDSHDPREPNVWQWKGFIDSLREMVDMPFQLNFAGGEALIHKDALELIRHASGRGFTTLLASNGWLIGEDMAKGINDTGLSVISLSLDGINEETHDFIRGAKGSYRRVMDAIGFLDKHCPHLKITICSLISAVNLEELVELVLWINKNEMIDGIGFQAVTQPFNSPIQNAWHLNPEYSFLWPKDIKRVNYALDSLMDISRYHKNNKIGNPISQVKTFKAYFRNPDSFIKKDVPCHLDGSAINVTPAGDMFFCFYMDPIGNIKTDNITEVWYSDKNEDTLRRIKDCRRNCQAVVNCNYNEDEINL